MSLVLNSQHLGNLQLAQYFYSIFWHDANTAAVHALVFLAVSELLLCTILAVCGKINFTVHFSLYASFLSLEKYVK